MPHSVGVANEPRLGGDFDTKRTFPGVSARLCLMGLASHTTISAAKLLASMCHRTVYIFFCSLGCVVARAAAIGATSDCFVLTRHLSSTRGHTKHQGSFANIPTEIFPKNRSSDPKCVVSCSCRCSRCRVRGFIRHAHG